MLPRTVQTVNTSNSKLCTDLFDEYLHHASTIDALILLDRLRQEFLLAANCSMKKSRSVPEMLSKRRQKVRKILCRIS